MMIENRKMKVNLGQTMNSLTTITGSNLLEIRNYCDKNNLSIIQEKINPFNGCYIVQAQRCNQRIRILRKQVEELEGWKLIEDFSTGKMHWLTYEKLSK